jgi:putative transposase
MSGDVHVQFLERLRVKIPWSTQPYILVSARWCYLYRVVDKDGSTVDFMLTEKRDRAAALKFFNKAMGSSGIPEKINIDKSGSNTAALERINTLFFLCGLWHLLIEIRRIKYLNNMVEQDHRVIKRITKYTLGLNHSQPLKLPSPVLSYTACSKRTVAKCWQHTCMEAVLSTRSVASSRNRSSTDLLKNSTEPEHLDYSRPIRDSQNLNRFREKEESFH